MTSGAAAALTIARVELVRFFRDRANYFFVFVLPLALIVFIGLQFAGGASSQIGVVADTDDPAAAEVIAQLDDADALTTVAVEDADRLASQVARSELSSGIVIPDGFTASLAAGEHVEVGFIARPDPASRSQRMIVEAAVAEAVAEIDAARHAARLLNHPVDEVLPAVELAQDAVAGIAVNVEPVGGDEVMAELAGLGAFDLGASQQLFLFIFLTSLTSSAALIQTRRYGVATRMLSTPTRLPVVLTGLAGGRLAIAVAQALYIVAITAVVFGVDWGDPVTATMLIVVFCVLSAAAGMVLGALFRNDSQAAGAGIGLGLVLAALGGSMMPLDFFPDGMRRVAMLTPHGWANQAMATIVRRGGTLADIAIELGVLAATSAVLLAVATWLLRRVIAR